MPPSTIIIAIILCIELVLLKGIRTRSVVIEGQDGRTLGARGKGLDGEGIGIGGDETGVYGEADDGVDDAGFAAVVIGEGV